MKRWSLQSDQSGPPNQLARLSARNPGEDIQGEACRRSAPTGRTIIRNATLVGRRRQAPPCESIPVGGTHRSACRRKSTHPIDNFDLTGLGTLESFASPAVRADCAASGGGRGGSGRARGAGGGKRRG